MHPGHHRRHAHVLPTIWWTTANLSPLYSIAVGEAVGALLVVVKFNVALVVIDTTVLDGEVPKAEEAEALDTIGELLGAAKETAFELAWVDELVLADVFVVVDVCVYVCVVVFDGAGLSGHHATASGAGTSRALSVPCW
jgi:hypothetical protein